jgi:hypothetical protein
MSLFRQQLCVKGYIERLSRDHQTFNRLSRKYMTGVQAYVQTVHPMFDIKEERSTKVHQTFDEGLENFYFCHLNPFGNA